MGYNEAMKTPTNRPYWHVDMKWICGILFALGLWATLALYTLSTLTSERIAVPVVTQIAAAIVGQHGMASPAEIEKFKQGARLLPGDKVETLPGIFITKTDLETLSADEIRLKIIGQIVSPYYELGPEGVAAKQTTNPEERAKIEQQVGFAGLINRSTHDTLQRLMWISLGLLAIPLAGLIYFSAGFGRLVSPGLIMAFTAFPGAIAKLILEIATRSSKPVGGNGSTGGVPGLSPESLEMIVRALLPGFLTVFTLGTVLLLAAAVGKTISKHRHPKTNQT